MSNFNLNNANKNALLQMASKKLGADPAQLQKAIESGQTDELTKSLDADTAAKVNGFLQDPEKLKALLGNQQIQQLLKNLGGSQG